MQCFLQPHLASGLLWWRGREESEGTTKTSVAETKCPIGLGRRHRWRGPCRCRLVPLGRSSPRAGVIPGPWPCALRQVELALLLKTRASVVLTKNLELGPVLGGLLREESLRRNGAGPTRGLLVLRADAGRATRCKTVYTSS